MVSSIRLVWSIPTATAAYRSVRIKPDICWPIIGCGYMLAERLLVVVMYDRSLQGVSSYLVFRSNPYDTIINKQCILVLQQHNCCISLTRVTSSCRHHRMRYVYSCIPGYVLVPEIPTSMLVPEELSYALVQPEESVGTVRTFVSMYK